MTYGDNDVTMSDDPRRDFTVFLGLVLGGAMVALAVSTVVGLAIGAGLYDTPPACHECEGCNP